MCAQSLPAQTTSMSRGSRANHCVAWTSLSNSRRPMPRPTICVALLLLGSIPFAELRAGSNISPRFAQPLPPPAPLWSTAPISPSASTSFSKLSHAPLPSSPSIPNTRPGAGKFTTQQRRTRLPALSGNSPKKSAPPAMTALSRSRPIAQAHIPEHTKLVLTPRPTASRCATRRAAVKVLPAVRCRPRAGSPASAVYSNFARSSLNWADGSFWKRRLGFRQLMFRQARRNTMFTGTGTALVTPFRADGSLDEATLRRLVQRQIDAGIDFLVPCGTTKSMPASICLWTNLRRVASSSEPSARNGVTRAVPVPVNIVFLLACLNINCRKPRRRFQKDPSAQFREDLAKFEYTALAGDPARGLQRTAGKTFTAARRVAQRDAVGRGVKTNFVCSGMCACAIGRERESAVIAGGADFFGEFPESAGRRVLL